MDRFVGNLTSRSRQRQCFDALLDAKPEPQTRFLMAAALVVVLAIGSDVFAADKWQRVEDIAATAEAFLLERSGKSPGNTAVRAETLDPRHRLIRCDAELEGFMRRGTKIGSRTIVGVRCTGNKPWKVYVPVDVIVNANVLAAARPLAAGQLVTKDDVAIVVRDVGRMHRGYYTDPVALAGLRLKQPLLAGQVITPAMLDADRIIRRGQTVTIVANSAGLNISMTGKALMDGAMNQRIRVENRNSGRVIEGIVRSPEYVEILVSANRGFYNAKPKVPADSADTRVSNNDR